MSRRKREASPNTWLCAPYAEKGMPKKKRKGDASIYSVTGNASYGYIYGISVDEVIVRD
jgi:hypothetical protein